MGKSGSPKFSRAEGRKKTILKDGTSNLFLAMKK